MAIPFVLLYPYYRRFDWRYGDFPQVNYYDDVWLIQAISENRQVVVTSWLDLCSKTSTLFSIFAALLALKHYLVIDRGKTDESKRVMELLAAKRKTMGRGRSIVLRSMQAMTPKTRTQVFPSHLSVVTSEDEEGIPTERVRHFMEVLLSNKKKLPWHEYLFLLWGLGILVIHIHATVIAVHTNVNGCLLNVRPWFKTTYTCVAFEINCAQGQFSDGSDLNALKEIVTGLNPHDVESFVVSSCSHFYVPPLLQTLSNVQMIKVFNTTIEQWDTNAALHQELHPDLQMLYVCDSNFSFNELPVGLLSDHFSSRLVDIEFSGTNLHGLPSNLHTKWKFVQYFVLERSPQIKTFPEPLVAMKIPQLMLCSNAITSIPDTLLADQSYCVFRLDGNPLTQLLKQIGTIEALYTVGMSWTFVSSLPQWMTARQSNTTTGQIVKPSVPTVNVYAGASPVCQDATTTSNGVMKYFQLNCSINIPSVM